ncbi:hypothetical protein [Accumulibacter sp.]|uniref:hypothetical protein n=1 Tax=Accumulibacter sp. TaxID=2053492 RepID=UPI0025CD544D|nr:hypothetical protein [Accumulibacter sp.]MCM8596442.1 hypothetical protein [Accumulibacter sp.]MCM8627083.1 hypothetical protein [Accumulibacter sp.]MDS4050591.1 hypothetical protein [Accumulibacter sp.]
MAGLIGYKGTVGEVSQVNANGKILRVYEFTLGSTWRKTLHWHPFYRGFCFDFHFDVSSAAAEKDVLKALDSVAYVAEKPRDADIDRLFYFFDWLRIRLSIPIDWKFAFRRPPPGPAGGILVHPGKGPMFSFLITPLGRATSGPSPWQPEIRAEEERQGFEARGDRVSRLSSRCTESGCFHYFDVTLRRDDSSDDSSPGDHGPQYRRLGFAKIGDVNLLLSMFYGDDSTRDAERFTDAINRARILDLIEFRRAARQLQEAPVK